ncbi:MAG: 23S rRNA (uridine(2552)-2'-O)-methyltransferase [Candidatus Hecatellales archaeon]|nr:MAG: 23S rRNA (uridine(2552)-2'-O)-methyltransferase [Candidatus Hecatellales archaeon]
MVKRKNLGWITKRKRDFFYRRAKAEGYRSRAAYKLLQANKSHRFIKPGNLVVDLGCAPGGWLQVASRLVGVKGKVLGVDVKEVKPLQLPNVQFLREDVLDENLPKKIMGLMGGRVDVVLSDLAPSVSGVWEVDHARQLDLASSALNIAKSVLKDKGTFFVKVFDGPYLKEFIDEMKKHFCRVKILKPKASRAESAELYLLGCGFKGLKQSP